MRNLSKSKLLAFRQCHRRLWLEIHRPELVENSAATQAAFKTGHEVGDIARKLYDPGDEGVLIDLKADGVEAACARTTEALKRPKPIFEAGFVAEGGLAFADVMLPIVRGDALSWRMVEVKASTSVKDYYRDDVAVQAYVASATGIKLESIAVAHIDRSFVYAGDQKYAGLLVENDLTKEAFSRGDEVKNWIAEAADVVKGVEPPIQTGNHCSDPYECGFLIYCKGGEPQATYPASLLPRVQTKALKAFINNNRAIELNDIPNDLLNERQIRVKSHTLDGTVFFDAVGAAQDLAAHKLPAYFLDFETIQFAVPIWKGTRPYDQIPFQFSLHLLSDDMPIEHRSFLDISESDPSEAFAAALVKECGSRGPVFVYNAAFETTRIRELAQRFPELSEKLLAINARIVDLLPIAQNRYYHPSQQGSWSIKNVLPAIAPDLLYDNLNGVQDGGGAMDAFLEALDASTTDERNQELRKQLLAYCELDTFAMVRIWEVFSGRNEPVKINLA